MNIFTWFFVVHIGIWCKDCLKPVERKFLIPRLVRDMRRQCPVQEIREQLNKGGSNKVVAYEPGAGWAMEEFRVDGDSWVRGRGRKFKFAGLL